MSETQSGDKHPPIPSRLDDETYMFLLSLTDRLEALEALIPARKPKKATRDPTTGSVVWQAYYEAYSARYGQVPVRNAKVNKQCSTLVERLGVDDAARVVDFYCAHNRPDYVERMHMLGPCVSDAEGLRTQMMLARNGSINPGEIE